MRMKERLEMNCRPNGWDYTSSYIRKPKKKQEYLQTVALICGTTSLPVLIGTGLLCIFSVIARVNLWETGNDDQTTLVQEKEETKTESRASIFCEDVMI